MKMDGLASNDKSIALKTPVASISSGHDANSGSSRILRSHRSLLVDHAYLEYNRRIELGEVIDPDEYCAQFPLVQSSLRQLIQLHSFFQENDKLLASPEYPAVGQSFLHFHLIHELGHGAFAKVFLAEDTLLGRPAALKLSRRAKAEAKLMARIEHKNIVLVHSIAEEDESGLTAICMPYRGSATLEHLLHEIHSQGRLPDNASIFLEVARELPRPIDGGVTIGTPSPVLSHGGYVDGVRSIGLQIAEALAFLHERAICHRDLKPSNILLTPDGTPMLLDFNLSSDYQTDATPFGGTLPYMAPEVLSALDSEQSGGSNFAAGVKADLYSFGVILYQLVTGKHPLGSFTLKLNTRELRDALLARRKEGVTPASEVNPKVDRAFSDLIDRCLATDPLQRPASALAIAAALQPVPPSEPTKKQPASTRRRSLIFAGVLFVALVLGAVSLFNVFRPLTIEERLDAVERSYQSRDYLGTIKQCQSLRVDAPKSTRVLWLSAQAKRQHAMAGSKDFFEPAQTDYQALQSLEPNPRNLAAIGYCWYGRGDYKKALATSEAAVNPQNENAEIRNNIGYCLIKLSEHSKAIESFDRAIKLNPKLGVAYYNRAKIALSIAFSNKGINETRTKPDQDDDPLPRVAAKANRSIKNGIDDIEETMRLGVVSRNVYFDAALLYAIAAETDRNQAKKAMEYLNRALRQGLNRSALKHPGLRAIHAEIAAELPAEIILDANVLPSVPRFLDPIPR